MNKNNKVKHNIVFSNYEIINRNAVLCVFIIMLFIGIIVFIQQLGKPSLSDTTITCNSGHLGVDFYGVWQDVKNVKTDYLTVINDPVYTHNITVEDVSQEFRPRYFQFKNVDGLNCYVSHKSESSPLNDYFSMLGLVRGVTDFLNGYDDDFLNGYDERRKS